MWLRPRRPLYPLQLHRGRYRPPRRAYAAAPKPTTATTTTHVKTPYGLNILARTAASFASSNLRSATVRSGLGGSSS